MYPSRLLVVLVAIVALLSLGLLIDVTWLWALMTIDGVVVAVALLDAVIGTVRPPQLAVEVTTAKTWSRGRSQEMTVTVTNRSRRGWNMVVAPDLPRVLEREEEPAALKVEPLSRLDCIFHALPKRRGRFAVGGAFIAVQSRLGLWHRRLHLGEADIIHVYPDLRQLADYALLARTDRLSLIGVRTARRLGGDTEFERLRDWHGDDHVNRIDWKATARRDVLTVRDYQINQSQSVMLVIDTGRMMAARAQTANGVDVSLLDLAIEAALMLAYVAIQQNDRVGLLAYADGIQRWIPPAGGTRHLHRLIHAVHDLEPTLVESRHDTAFMHLGRHHRKRSLITQFTNVLDDVNADLLLRQCTHLVGRHVPMLVLLRDPDVHDVLRTAPKDEAGFWHSGAAAIIATWRQGIIDRLTTAGALVVDADADRLTPATISEYLMVKAKHLL